MGNFASYAAELTGNIPKLPDTLAKKHINRAWEAIRRQRLWSFLISETGVFFPDILPSSSAGAASVQVTYGSPTVVGNAAAAADWTPQILGPPVPLIQRQFRVGSGGPLYNITAISTTVNPTDTLTLDQPYGEDSSAATSYSIYRAYAKAPSVDFKRWQTVYDPVNGYPLMANLPRLFVDNVDPTRGSMGQAYRVINYMTDPTDNRPVFEWWPHPTTQITYHTLYERRGTDFVSNSDTLPPQIPESFLIDWALAYFSYPWANANVGRFPELKGTNWLNLAIEAKRIIHGQPGQPGMLQSIRRADEEAFQQTLTLLRRSWGISWPLSGSFEQQHSLWNIGGP